MSIRNNPTSPLLLRRRATSSLKKEFHTATHEEIRSGEVTDVYFARTLEVLRAKGVRKHVLGQLKSLPALENLK